MPIPPRCSDQPAIVCCDTLFTVTQNVAIVAGDAVRNCFGESCRDIPVYVTHGEPQGGGDYVVAWLAAIGSPNVLPGKTFFVTARLNINVAVAITGYPGIEIQGGEFAPVGSPDEQTHASYFSYGSMEAAYRALWKQLAGDGQLGGCTVAGMSNLVPQPVQDGTARWLMTVFIDMDV